MFDDQILNTVTGRLSTRFDGVPESTIRAIVREALITRETARFDSAPATPAKAAPARTTRTDGLAALKQAQADVFAGAGQRDDSAPDPARATRTDGLSALKAAQDARFKGEAA
ncbi:MAG: hypothetical protein LC676_08040 [Loktanella sp.]|nr:hypothetical protein [Loktanella sp.]